MHIFNFRAITEVAKMLAGFVMMVGEALFAILMLPAVLALLYILIAS